MGDGRPDEAKLTRQFDSGTEAREAIDLGTAFTTDLPLARLSGDYPYQMSNVPHDNIRVVVHKKGAEDDIQAVTLGEDSLEGLSDEERQDLVEAIGADEHGNTYAKDGDGLTFATNLVIERYPELRQFATDHGKWKVANIHELLPNLSKEQKSEFVNALWEYRKLRARAVIDFLSDDVGRQQVELSTGRVALRDLAIERTNNLHSSNIKQKA